VSKEIALHLPVNAVSFGQVSVGILKEFYRRKLEPCLFLIGNQADLSVYNQNSDFNKWLEGCIAKATKDHKRSNPIFKLWHINGSFESYSDKQVLLTFYELDSPTAEEINILKNNHKVLVSSEYCKRVFEDNGVSNIHYIPLAFDSDSFHVKDNSSVLKDRITFNVVGKLERRKHHAKVIKSWAMKYGNNKDYYLNCSIFNHFLKPEDQQKLIASILENKSFFNINFLGFMPTNATYNDYLNSSNIIIGMSGGEGWGLPEFNSLCLGKHGVILNAHSYKGWANEENSVLVNPTGKIEAYDNVFFRKGSPYNQGNIFDFNHNDFLSACDQAIQRVKTNKVNEAGLKLQKQFTYEKMVDSILSHM
jgi:glycosyltransferase involved in cell wall biosynthesis